MSNRQWKLPDPLFPPSRSLEDKQQMFLSVKGPGLESLREEVSNCPFRKIRTKNSSFADNKPSDGSEQIIIRNGRDSNLRAFYYMLLQVSIPQDVRTDQKSSHLFKSLKAFLYSESTLIAPFTQQYNHRRFHKILSNNASVKKLLAEALLQLVENRCKDLCEFIERNPVLDCVFVSALRCLVNSHHHYLPELKAIERPISTDLLVNSLRRQFGAKIDYTPFGELVLEDRIVMRQQKEYTYLRRYGQSMVDSTNWKKTSESSESNVALGNILDMSKSLADISAIEPKHREEGEGEIQITVVEEPQPVRPIKGFGNVRRCQSLSSPHELSEATQSKQNTSREKHEKSYKIRQAQSEKDDDSNESAASCVIYKVEFGGGRPPAKLPTPRSNKKELSPRKPITKIVERDLNKNLSIENLQLKVQEAKKRYLGQPSIQTLSSPSFNDQLDSAKYGSTGNPHRSEKLYTIPSVDDSCIEESMLATSGLDCESMKDKLYEGTTSQAVLKILSPSVARIVLRKKQESVKNLIEKINKTSYASSIRSSLDMGDSSERMTAKMFQLSEASDYRRTSIGGATSHLRSSIKTIGDFTRKQGGKNQYTSSILDTSGPDKHFDIGDYRKQPSSAMPLVPKLVFGASIFRESSQGSHIHSMSKTVSSEFGNQPTKKVNFRQADRQGGLSPPISARNLSQKPTPSYKPTPNFIN